ncbi:MAG: aminoacyl-tRNA deacylase [Nitrososphaeria archaeon]
MDDKDLQEYIRENNVDAEIFYFERNTMTVDSAVEQMRVPRDVIVKSILVFNERNEPYMVFVNGDRRVSFDKVARITDSDSIRMAKAKEVKEVTGYEVGGVPPIFYRHNVNSIVDERLLIYDFLVGGGGATHALLKIRPKDIVRLNDAIVADIGE